MTQKEIKDLWDVLRFHAHTYPQMECRDGLKLLYQNEFGGGHLISDPQNSLHYLKEELGMTDVYINLDEAKKLNKEN